MLKIKLNKTKKHVSTNISTTLEMKTTSQKTSTSRPKTAYETKRTTRSQELTTDAKSITKTSVVETTTKQRNTAIDNINSKFFTKFILLL